MGPRHCVYHRVSSMYRVAKSNILQRTASLFNMYHTPEIGEERAWRSCTGSLMTSTSKEVCMHTTGFVRDLADFVDLFVNSVACTSMESSG